MLFLFRDWFWRLFLFLFTFVGTFCSRFCWINNICSRMIWMISCGIYCCFMSLAMWMRCNRLWVFLCWFFFIITFLTTICYRNCIFSLMTLISTSTYRFFCLIFLRLTFKFFKFFIFILILNWFKVLNNFFMINSIRLSIIYIILYTFCWWKRNEFS